MAKQNQDSRETQVSRSNLQQRAVSEGRELTNEESAAIDAQARNGGQLTKEQRRALDVQSKQSTERVTTFDQLPDVLRRSGAEVAVGKDEIDSLVARNSGRRVIAFVQDGNDTGAFDQPITVQR